MNKTITLIACAAVLALGGCTTTSTTTTTERTTTTQPQTNASTDASIYNKRTAPMPDRGPR